MAASSRRERLLHVVTLLPEEPVEEGVVIQAVLPFFLEDHEHGGTARKGQERPAHPNQGCCRTGPAHDSPLSRVREQPRTRPNRAVPHLAGPASTGGPQVGSVHEDE